MNVCNKLNLTKTIRLDGLSFYWDITRDTAWNVSGLIIVNFSCPFTVFVVTVRTPFRGLSVGEKRAILARAVRLPPLSLFGNTESAVDNHKPELGRRE